MNHLNVAVASSAFTRFLMAHERDIHRWRQAIAGVLREWGVPPPAAELACFGISELLTNVARHASDSRCRLEVSRLGTTATVSVFDRSPVLPVVTEPEWSTESGRGLWLLQQMAGPADFGIRRAEPPWGKAVWFRCGTQDAR